MTWANGSPVRHFIVLFALFALFWSGFYAEPADAHEGAKNQVSASAAPPHGDEDNGQSDLGGGDQHACHHHCPNAPAPRAPEAEVGTFCAKQPLFATIMAALRPFGRAPPLDPPIP